MDVGWISPSGATGPVVPLGRHRGNGGGGFAVSLNAIGPTTVLAAFDTKETGAMVSEQIAASGHVSGRTVVFKDDGATQQFTAGNGSRVVLAWQPGEFDSLLYASVWDRGRWSPPTLLDKCRGSRATALLCPDLAGVAINSSGKTAVTWAFGGGTVFRPFAAID
jgi:hypothetical protein